jgi:DegV family protein with EDD domain
VRRVAIVSETSCDLDPLVVAPAGITIVPLTVSFGTESFRAGLELSAEAFWARMTSPEKPQPSTAAPNPWDFLQAYEAAFAAGAEEIVSIHAGSQFSTIFDSARAAAAELPERVIRVIDTGSGSMAEGLLVLMAAEMADAGASADEIAAAVKERVADTAIFLTIDSFEYLRRGGRVSLLQAALATALTIKPVFTLRGTSIELIERPRTRSKAREALIAAATTRPVERLGIVHAMVPEIETFRDELVARVPGGIDPSTVTLMPIGPTAGTHLGPGAYGVAVLYRR